ncbi:MAG: hypothetical protein WDN69_16710 [Aliidongia sp.]
MSLARCCAAIEVLADPLGEMAAGQRREDEEKEADEGFRDLPG